MGTIIPFGRRGQVVPFTRQTAFVRGEALREVFVRADATFTENPTPENARAARAAKLQLVRAAQQCFAPFFAPRSGAYTMAMFDDHLDKLCPGWRTAPVGEVTTPNDSGSAA